MKISIALAILILVVAAGFGWQDHQRLASVRERHAKIVAEAAMLGIFPDPAHRPGRVLVTRGSQRDDKQATAKLVAAKFITFAKDMEALEKAGERPDEAMQKRMMEFMDLMMSLDPSQLKTVIAEVRATTDLKDEMRQNLIGYSIITMANDHPRAALTLFTESSDFFKDSRIGNSVISTALRSWAMDDPIGALEWMRKNGEKYPAVVSEEAKRAVISGAAAQDPKLALQLIGELKPKEATQAVSSIVNAAKTPEERTATLAALREHAATLTDHAEREKMMNNAISSLANSAAKEGFQAGSEWLSNAGLSSEEIENVSAYNIKPAETGQWIEWLGEKLPSDKADIQIQHMVRRWTENDYRAAGTWLANAADGSTKQAAIQSYAQTIASYDPETAAEWALTLPDGEKRTQTLKRIHQNWPKDDANGAEAFAKEHGITK